MRHFNNVFLVGRLVDDCDIRTIKNRTIIRFILGVEYDRKSRGLYKTSVNRFEIFHIGKIYGGRKEDLKKGSLVLINGQLSRYTPKNISLEMKKRNYKTVVQSKEIYMF